MKQWTVERTLLSLTKKKINATEHSFRKNLVTQYTCQIMKSCTNEIMIMDVRDYTRISAK